MIRPIPKIAVSVWLITLTSVAWMPPEKAFPQQAGNRAYPLDAGLYYTIQKGDTLWDLSEHFFDSPWVWPDLWGKNTQIHNPHWIYPGKRIRIYDRKAVEQVGKTLPPCTPQPETPKVEARPATYYYPAMDAVGFIRKKPLPPAGIIFKITADKEMASERDLVYVRPKSAREFKTGDRLTVFRTLPISDRTDNPVGIQHKIVGVLEIGHVDRQFCTARIVKSFRQIERGDLLTPYTAGPTEIQLRKSKPRFKGKIIASEKRTELIGTHDLVFIDKGRKNGVEPGQSYGIYRHETGALDEGGGRVVPLTPIDMGNILILRVEQSTATALVTSANEWIEPGTNLRTPTQDPIALYRPPGAL
ncbi:MAG: LysM peptidoglycan-binding domain-containing protein [Deltaproteobacteria bacterium]|nr:LysM peptidoglycan-binding domain-containing protein [Deltaproteobacteria bacterium]